MPLRSSPRSSIFFASTLGPSSNGSRTSTIPEEDITDPFDSDDLYVPEDEPGAFVVPTTFTAPFKIGVTNSTDLIYQGTFAAEYAPSSEVYSNQLIKVTVVVSWNRSGKTRNCTGVTDFSRYGLQNNIPH